MLEHLRMERVLKAEESLRRVTENALGFGLVPKHQADQIKSEWRRNALMGDDRKRGPTTLGQLTAGGAISIHTLAKEA